MFNESVTKEKLGYSIESLTSGSHKSIYMICDYCNETYKSTRKIINQGRKKLNKDACKKCRYKKREDIELKLYGGTSPSQRDSVKEKMRETCQRKYGKDCFSQTEEFAKKTKQTNLRKYGVEHAGQSKEIQDKRKKTMVEKYGADNPSQVPEFVEKRKNTFLEKYGTESALGAKEVRDKINQSVKEKYGVDNVFQADFVKEKMKDTNLEKYGCEYPVQNEDVRAKTADTNLIKYGHKNASQNEDVKQKIKNTNLEKYGYPCVLQNDDVKDKIRQTNIKAGNIKILDGEDMQAWAEKVGVAYSTFKEWVRKYGFEEAISMEKNESGLEKRFAMFLDSHNINYQQQFKVENRYADFFLPDYNIIIEADGTYYHSDIFIDDKNYHKNKRELYIKHGYTPFFFREDELNNKFDIIQSILFNKMGKSERIFARKCSLRPVDKEESKSFFETNHLMGKGRGQTFGLYYNDILVSCLQLCNRGHGIHEIARFAHAKGHCTVGGFSRLLKQAITDCQPAEVITFIDLRYGTGDYLPKLGFEPKAKNLSFRWTCGSTTFHRMKFPKNTGYDEGLAKIWDCGQAKYVYGV